MTFHNDCIQRFKIGDIVKVTCTKGSMLIEITDTFFDEPYKCWRYKYTMIADGDTKIDAMTKRRTGEELTKLNNSDFEFTKIPKAQLNKELDKIMVDKL